MIAKLCSTTETSPTNTLSSSHPPNFSLNAAESANSTDILPQSLSVQAILLSIESAKERPNCLENWPITTPQNSEAWDRNITQLMNEEGGLSPVDEILQYLHNNNSNFSLGNQSQKTACASQSYIQKDPNDNKPEIPDWIQAQQSCCPPEEQEALNLLQLLFQCAESISENKLEKAKDILPQISELSTPFGSPIHRIAAYFAEAISCRIITTYLKTNSVLTNRRILSAFQVFNGITPFIKFSHFTANHAIQQAVHNDHVIHIIDLDIMQGLQWPGLFHLLSSRPGRRPPYVRITGLGNSLPVLEATGKRLSSFAEKLGIPFEFQAIEGKASEISADPKKLNIRRGETIAVHWFQHSLYDISGSEDETLALLAKLRPSILTLVEQDLRRSGSFMERFMEAMRYYSALFDSLGSAYPPESLERHLVEQQLLGWEMRNVLGIPGRDGEKKMQWRERLQNVGFGKISLAGNAAAQASLLLGMFPCEGYSLVEESGVLRIGWREHFLFTASAWQPLMLLQNPEGFRLD